LDAGPQSSICGDCQARHSIGASVVPDESGPTTPTEGYHQTLHIALTVIDE